MFLHLQEGLALFMLLHSSATTTFFLRGPSRGRSRNAGSSQYAEIGCIPLDRETQMRFMMTKRAPLSESLFSQPSRRHDSTRDIATAYMASGHTDLSPSPDISYNLTCCDSSTRRTGIPRLSLLAGDPRESAPT